MLVFAQIIGIEPLNVTERSVEDLCFHPAVYKGWLDRVLITSHRRGST